MASTAPRQQPAALFSLPNQLTTSRLVLAVVLFVLIEWERWTACVVVFGIAAVTDWLDGFVARWQGQTSALGRVLDPLVDKVLVCGAFIFLLPRGQKDGWLTPWMVTVVVSRELIITGLRGYLEMGGAKFGADWLGKIKMTLQCVALVVVFYSLGHPVEPLPLVRDLCIWAMILATILSGVQYLWRAFLIWRHDSGLA